MFWFVILIAGIITGIFLFLKHKKSKDSSNEAVNRIENQETVEQTVISNPQNTRTEPITNSSATICVSTSSLSSHEVEIMIDENEDVSMIDLGRRSESGGYINWSIYQVIGKSSTTNKKNTRRYEAKDREHVIRLAESDGLIGPFEINPIPYPVEPDKIEYYSNQLNSCGILPPQNAVKEDLREILNRVRYSDDVVSEKECSSGIIYRRVRPIPGPSKEFAEYADDLGIKFSMYISGPGLFTHTILNLEPREKAAFYAYCLICAHTQRAIENPKKSQYADKLYKFADMAIDNPVLLKSITGRGPSDYLNPHKGSKAYKAVAEYFSL